MLETRIRIKSHLGTHLTQSVDTPDMYRSLYATLCYTRLCPETGSFDSRTTTVKTSSLLPKTSSQHTGNPNTPPEDKLRLATLWDITRDCVDKAFWLYMMAEVQCGGGKCTDALERTSRAA